MAAIVQAVLSNGMDSAMIRRPSDLANLPELES